MKDVDIRKGYIINKVTDTGYIITKVTDTGLGTVFFSILNVLFFSVLLKNAMFFSILFFEFLVTYETQKNDAVRVADRLIIYP